MTVEEAIAKIEAEGRAYGERAAADAALEVTLTAEIMFRGDVLKVEMTGIGPFAAVRSCGPIMGIPCWTVIGQPYSKDGIRHAYADSWDSRGKRFGGLYLKASEATDLADKLNAQLPTHSSKHEAA